ncbi:TPA: hypothetical protein QDB15_001097 [Burkholderia vietnamiensis]|uniref:hypothetical protein n=1 Tax=Burkholderia vietnamiensis TaxID=60552 RepID=UPI001592F745|nr:hypothetical protein [Burkholderia vietnamiensis]MCA8210322.1 hypothetical protein [Burkholderia vietnamiensis]HDR9100065.1 hypothetical protein [Burkholderia vietnamiensis]HDR9117350.1 hypothetical protein [Burkholderia vietnamiensis]
MSLQKDMTFNGVTIQRGGDWELAPRPCTISVPACVITVDSVSGTKDQCLISVTMTGDGFQSRRSYAFNPDPNGDNYFKQAYAYLLTLPDFANAVNIG